jgi:hypothetical protein
LGGPARLVAAARGCRVVCVDLSPDYCAGARLLNRLTGLEDRVSPLARDCDGLLVGQGDGAGPWLAE